MSVVIPGIPVPASRPRLGKGRTYNLTRYTNYKQLVSDCCVEEMIMWRKANGLHRIAKWEPAIPTGPVTSSLTFFLPLPKKDHRVRNPPAQKPHTSRPDLDNLIKSLLDGATGFLFTDDSQVCRFRDTSKWVCGQGEEPRAVITVEQYE